MNAFCIIFQKVKRRELESFKFFPVVYSRKVFYDFCDDIASYHLKTLVFRLRGRNILHDCDRLVVQNFNLRIVFCYRNLYIVLLRVRIVNNLSILYLIDLCHRIIILYCRFLFSGNGKPVSEPAACKKQPDYHCCHKQEYRHYRSYKVCHP